MKRLLCLFSVFVLFTQTAVAEQPFSDLVGSVRVQEVRPGVPVNFPWITWGGDVVTFYANGNSVVTKPGSPFAQQGLSYKLVQGDDFVGQCRSYLKGETPYIRGTMGMLGLASEVLGKDPRTKPVVVLQMTYSLGDHMVARQNFKTLNDLKGKKVKICLQQGGPHVSFVQDTLDVARLTWNDVVVVWTKDLSGPNGPAAKFKADPSIDICCVITPDMLGLTSGLDATGSGAEGTVRGAHVINSTSSMNRVIADVIAVRSDYFNAAKPAVAKTVAAYLKAATDVVAMRGDFQTNGFTRGSGPKYKELLTFAQNQFGREVIPTLETDAHGLMLDAQFVGLTGNISFFEDAGNLNGFEPSMKKLLEMAVEQGYASRKFPLVNGSLDFKEIATIAGIEYKAPTIQKRIDAEKIEFFPGQENLDDKTLYSFAIQFSPDQTEFSTAEYGQQFDEAVKAAAKYGNAVILIKGHADPTRTLSDLIKAGIAKGIIARSGSPGAYQYFINTSQGRKQLDLSQTKLVAELIEKGAFDGTDPNPRDTMQAALNLSKQRAAAVRESIIKYAKQKGYNLDESQLVAVGAGILEPLISKPKNQQEANTNMRVSLSIQKIAAEAIKPSDFDF